MVRVTVPPIRAAQKIEDDRRSRKLTALRAGLGLVLHELNAHLVSSAAFLVTLHNSLAPGTTAQPSISPLPSKPIADLLAFIEVADNDIVDVSAFLLQSIQIQHARLLSLERPLRASAKMEILGYLADTVMVHTLMAQFYPYARREKSGVEPPIRANMLNSATHLVANRAAIKGLTVCIDRRFAGVEAGTWLK
jgi:hypothetical protein